MNDIFLKYFKGEILNDNISRTIYATDASAYKEEPTLVLIPRDANDVKLAIAYARSIGQTIIPRTAGTSLAGQVVGNGIVVDCSKYMNKIVEINTDENWVRVEPGVVLDELNKYLAPLNLFFGPETSTSNRCMIGGMVGNNSCGAHSLVYGSTRDHTLEVKAFLSDGSEVLFKELTAVDYEQKLKLENLEGKLYRQISGTLNDKNIRNEIESEFPAKEIERRNTGYAIDLISRMKPFSDKGENFNFCSLVCGSEGTLAFITEIKLNLVSLPPKENALLVVHHNTIEEALQANIEALKFKPVAIELIDKFLLDCTKDSMEHKHNRFFIEGDPGAVLCIEFAENEKELIIEKSDRLIESFKANGFGYHYPLLFGKDISKVWALRKAGLGLLSNIPGDAKPQPVIEDTAVSPKVLPQYIKEFNQILKEQKLECVYYAHIATGELHLRPVLNLKTDEGVTKFRIVAEEIARLVKKYKGSLSGEHGDGRLRGEFIPFMIGEKNYKIVQDIKQTWDPNHVFNWGKITATPPMHTSLRFTTNVTNCEPDTLYDFSDTLGVVRMADKCNGSGDCRKSALIGGTMCPSYQATRDEKNTTRARANMLREVLNSENGGNKFDNNELYEVLDLCLSCKGCKTECPSGVDMAKLKSEFLYQYYQSNRIPIRNYLVAGFAKTQAVATKIAGFYNFTTQNKWLGWAIKTMVGFATQRSLPMVYSLTWRKWLKKNLGNINPKASESIKELVLFVDEFTNYNEPYIGIAATKLLTGLGYRVKVLQHPESGRAKFSKGFLKQGQAIAKLQIDIFSQALNNNIALVGIEPSAILSFKDEYPDLLKGNIKQKAIDIAEKVFTIEEFMASEFSEGSIKATQFTAAHKEIKYHGHCQQKALIGTSAANAVLSIPENYSVNEIQSGCCGMAGSFGYEKEHFKLSMRIGEMVLFPAVRNASPKNMIAASGTSCRHHIKDGTGKKAVHPVEIMWEAFIKK